MKSMPEHPQTADAVAVFGDMTPAAAAQAVHLPRMLRLFGATPVRARPVGNVPAVMLRRPAATRPGVGATLALKGMLAHHLKETRPWPCATS